MLLYKEMINMEQEHEQKNGKDMISVEKSEKIASRMAVLLQDLQMLVLKIDDSDRVNQGLPRGVFIDGVKGSERDLKELGVEMSWFDDYSDKSDYKVAKQMIFDIRNRVFDVEVVE